MKLRRQRNSVPRLLETFRNLPMEDKEYRLPSSECPECGHELKCLGLHQVRLEVEYIPAKVRLHRIMQETCTCPACSQTKGQTIFVKAAIPEPVLQHSYATASSVAQAIYQKYVQAVPLYRQVKDWQRMGVDLSRATLSNWIIKSSQEHLEPLVTRLKQELLQQTYLHADETPVQVLQEPGRRNESQSYMWVFASPPRSDRAIRIFHYAPTRGSTVPQTFLRDFHGYLLTDDYSSYNHLPDTERCSCWAHVRRKFKEAIPADTKDPAYTIAEEGLALCNTLFERERQWESISTEERKRLRLEQSVPILARFWDYVDRQISRSSTKTKLGRAFAYTKSNQERLMRFLEDGRLEISNAVAENAIRPFAIGRKNWLFSGSPKGAEISGWLYSIIETAKANHLDPQTYLQTLFERLPSKNGQVDPAVLDSLLPWSADMQASCRDISTQN